MVKKQDEEIILEIIESSDGDTPPECCPYCQSKNYIQTTYYIRELQEFGTLTKKRIIRHENVYWKCKDCDTEFQIHDPQLPGRTPYTQEIIDYAIYRVLQKGDSAARVADDLRKLHNVDITRATINTWINIKTDPQSTPTEYVDKHHIPDFSGVLALDGTFKSVKSKKKELPEDENAQYCLYLTQLPDDRLVAYWRKEKKKEK